MADVHRIIAVHGIEEARRQAVTKRERQTVETAFQVLSDDDERIGFTYSAFAVTGLPHRDPKVDLWKRESGGATLFLETGRQGDERPIGIPYGSYARFILLFLQTEAIRTQSREIELGRSMRVWLGSMGLSIGGATYKAVFEQARRISASKLTFIWPVAGQEFRRNSSFVRDAITMTGTLDDWKASVVLDEAFYMALREHPVPVSEAALRAIGPRSMALDVYIWLAWRLHSLKDRTPISWASLYRQFGQDYARSRKFKENFLESLQLALAAYPDARVSADKAGLVLYPSRPPVSPRLVGCR